MRSNWWTGARSDRRSVGCGRTNRCRLLLRSLLPCLYRSTVVGTKRFRAHHLDRPFPGASTDPCTAGRTTLLASVLIRQATGFVFVVAYFQALRSSQEARAKAERVRDSSRHSTVLNPPSYTETTVCSLFAIDQVVPVGRPCGDRRISHVMTFRTAEE